MERPLLAAIWSIQDDRARKAVSRRTAPTASLRSRSRKNPLAWPAAAAIWGSPQSRARLRQKPPSDIPTLRSQTHLKLVATGKPSRSMCTGVMAQGISWPHESTQNGGSCAWPAVAGIRGLRRSRKAECDAAGGAALERRLLDTKGCSSVIAMTERQSRLRRSTCCWSQGRPTSYGQY